MLISKEKIKEIYLEEYKKQNISALKLEEKYSLPKHYLYRWFNNLSLTMRSNAVNSLKYHCNESFFENIDTEEKAYWLGFIYADGYITSKRKQCNRKLGISLSIKDINHLEKFNNSIDGDAPIHTYEQKSGYSVGNCYCRVVYQSKKLTDDLIRQGVVENKTNILSAPNLHSDDLVLAFVRGYFDGDGSVWMQGKSNIQASVSFVGTDDILIFIMDYLIKCGVLKRHYNLCKRKKTSDCF